MNWINEILQQHSELESPSSFYFWSSLATISAIVKDNIWINRYIHNLYPNIYVMLHADSGLKKGPSISAAKQMVTMVNNTRIISGRSSIQAILKEMGTAQTAPGGKIIGNDSTAFICSSELSSSIVEDPVATKILTDLYDRQYNLGQWRSLLKMETFTLKNPTITMLTATNDAMSEDFFNRSTIQGGYIARTFIVHETQRNRLNSLLVPLKNPPNYKKSAEYLTELAKLKGEFTPLGSQTQSNIFVNQRMNSTTGEAEFFSKTGVIYQDWYEKFYSDIIEYEIKDNTGTLNRFGDSVLKIAMLLSLSKEPRLEIDPNSMQEAIDVCQKLVGGVRKTTHGLSGLSSTAVLKAKIIAELFGRDNHQVTRAVLMKKLWMDFGNSEEFDDMMLSFDSSGMIVTKSMGNQIVYVMPENQVVEMKRFYDGKLKKSKE